MFYGLDKCVNVCLLTQTNNQVRKVPLCDWILHVNPVSQPIKHFEIINEMLYLSMIDFSIKHDSCYKIICALGSELVSTPC